MPGASGRQRNSYRRRRERERERDPLDITHGEGFFCASSPSAFPHRRSRRRRSRPLRPARPRPRPLGRYAKGKMRREGRGRQKLFEMRPAEGSGRGTLPLTSTTATRRHPERKEGRRARSSTPASAITDHVALTFHSPLVSVRVLRLIHEAGSGSFPQSHA